MSKGKNKISSFKKKWILVGVLVFFAIQLLMPIIVMPKQANAVLGVGDTTITLGDIPRLIWDSISSAIKKAGAVAFKNAVKTFANNLAYNAATGLATGEKGEKPLFTTEPLKILEQAADIAAGDFLDSVAGDWLGKAKCAGYYGEDVSCKDDQGCPTPVLDCTAIENFTSLQKSICSEGVEFMEVCLAQGCVIEEIENREMFNFLMDIGVVGVNNEPYIEGSPKCTNDFSLCDQSDLFKVNINIKTRASLDPATKDTISGKCQVTDIIDIMEQNVDDANNLWEDLTNKEKNNLYLQQIAKGFNPEVSELGAYITISNRTKDEAAKAQKNTEFSEQLSGGLSSVTSKISGAVKTPGPLLESAINSTFKTSLDLQNTFTGEIIADAIGTFTSTLANKMMDKYFEGLVEPELNSGGGSSSLLGGLLGGVRSGITAAKLLFADLKQVNYSVGGNLDILSSLASCPDTEDPTQDTCVIDSRFYTAIEQQLTVREALDAGLLDGNKLFGYDINGNQPEYYNGYPYRSLVILRKYRVLPVGWELAANYMREYARGFYSLNILIDEYDNIDSPFYHLVDPNWVLKAPSVYCERQGAGDKIEYSDAIRSEDTNKLPDSGIDSKDAAIPIVTRNSNYCADEQLCLIENDDGSCKKYGYCIEEEPIWKFAGAACQEEYSSCQSFGENENYLTNSLDYGTCNSENAGCQWYCQDYDLVSGEWQCTNQDPPAGGNKISFNDNAESCSANGEGCSEYIPITNSGANLVKNSNFEDFDTTADVALATDGLRDLALPIPPPFGGTSLPDDFADWSHNYVNGVDPCQQRSLASSDSFGGLTAARIHQYPACPSGDGQYMTQRLDTGYLTDNRTFTVSFYAKRAEGGTCNATNDNVLIDFTRNFAPASPGPPPILADVQYVGGQTANVSADWTRYALTFNFDSQPASRWNWGTTALNNHYKRTFILFVRHNSTDCDILIDNIQVEEGGLTNYKAYEDSSKTYLKKAPEYLNCTGGPFDDPLCLNFALNCSADEVGCQKFTSTTSGQSVTGTITNIGICNPNDPSSCDQCPLEFVGCQAYRELATENVPYRPAVDPVSFVQETGLSCPASAVGCEEYTNLEEIAAGGEGREYYSWIKQCVEESDPNVSTYYTWEGSEEFGYQLKDYQLKTSNVADPDILGPPLNTTKYGPCTNMAPEDPYLDTLGLGWNTCIDDEVVDRNGDGIIDETYDMQVCTLAEVGVDPDCAEFIDEEGYRFYRLKSKVIYTSSNCKVYRNSLDSGATCQAGFCTNNNSICATDSTCTDILYHMIPNQGNSCSAQYAGCRAYKGNAGDNSHVIYSYNFESGDLDTWNSGVPANPTLLSNESVNFGGHSMLFFDAAYYRWLTAANELLPIKGNSYNLSFWAKAGTSDSIIEASFGQMGFTKKFEGSAVARVGEWNQYEVGPLYVDWDVLPNSISMFFETTGSVYIDNIQLSEIVDNIYKVKDSYTRCDGYENCDQYTDIPGATHYLKSFSSLCGEDKIGCEAMIDTKNSSTPGELEYEVAAGVLKYIPKDTTITLVNDPNKRCSAGEKGCEWLGVPTINSVGNVSSFDDAYIKNDPDKYDTDLCLFEESGCKEYITPEGSKYYFKDPTSNICEYKRVAGQSKSGWYQNETNVGEPDCPVTVGVCKNSPISDEGKACGTDLDCDDGAGFCAIGYCEDNTTLCSDNGMCVGDCIPSFNVVPQPNGEWAGVCPITASTCTEYRDPEKPFFYDSATPGDITYCDVTLADGGSDGDNTYDCDSYYYLSNEIDEASCNGLVDREEGCLLFNNTAAENLIFYADDTKNGTAPEVCDITTVPPEECDSNIIIKVNKDRVCGRWIDCETSIPPTDGSSNSLCTEINICEKMDSLSTNCIKWDGKASDINQTYDTPAFVDKIKNYSGLVLAGLDWDKRCTNDTNKVCLVDTDCGTLPAHKCSDPQIYEGSLPTALMSQVGSAAFNGNLIPDGDFGDSNYKLNQKLSCPLSGGDAECEEIKGEPNELELDLNQFFTTKWYPREIDPPAPSTIYWTEETDKGIVPSPNGNLDENNIAKIVTPGDVNKTGISYNLGDTIIKDYEYAMSFKLRWSSVPSEFDKIRVELEYRDPDGVLVNWNQRFAEDITPSENWTEYALGPIPAGFDEGLTTITNYGDVSLNIIHVYDPAGGAVPSVTFYIDDVSMDPVLTTKNGTCQTVSDDLAVQTAYEVTGFADKQCNSIGDCATAGFNDLAVKCEGMENIARSCRLYPKDDSRYCTYVDQNNTTFQGWYGYCLEQDPNNSEYCLNWWPVDLLSGESDVFGTLPPFNLKIRQPLYMCLEAEGNYNNGLFIGNIDVNDNNWNSCHDDDNGNSSKDLPEVASPLVGITKGYQQTMVTPHDRTPNWHGDSCNQQGEVYNLIPNRDSGTHPGVLFSCDDGDGGCGSPSAPATPLLPEDQYYMWEIERIVVVGQLWSHEDWDPKNASKYRQYNDAGNESMDFSNSAVYGDDPNINGFPYFIFPTDYININNLKASWSSPGSTVWSASYGSFNIDVGGNDGNWDPANVHKSNIFTFSLIFDANDKLTTIGTYIHDYDNGGAFWATPIFYLKDQCTRIVGVNKADNTNKAWASKLNSNSSYRVPDLDYTYNQFSSPYGGIIQPSPITSEPVNWNASNGAGPLFLQSPTNHAHAGSAYSFVSPNDSAGRLCSVIVAGANYSTQNVCLDMEDVEECNLAGGTCIGTGQGFCEQDPTIFCRPTLPVADPIFDTDCEDSSFDYYGPCIMGTGGAAGIINYTDGMDIIRLLFANTFQVWDWNDTGGLYEVSSSVVSTDLVDQDANTSIYNGMPLCLPVGSQFRTPNTYCGIPPVLDVTLSNSPGQTVDLSHAGGRVSFTVNVKADPEQLPITQIEIDWNALDGDSVDQTLFGPFDSGTFIINHVYTTSGSGGQTFQPQFKVIDNWDWCGASSDEPCTNNTNCRNTGEPGYTCDWVNPGIFVNVSAI
ncbi:MAG: hypothetical protein ACNFW9_06355 [Candidatus Kerfeldbacteria bacterium]